MSDTIYTYHWKSPIGELVLAATDDELYMCDWMYRRMRSNIDKRVLGAFHTIHESKNRVIEAAIEQLKEYLHGTRREFDIPIAFIGTEFQKSVWKELMTIPFGKTNSYLQLAKSIDNIDAIRAVASANGANALSILVPCHRIIGSDGDLVGYAGGLSIKKKLLQLEGSYSQISLF